MVNKTYGTVSPEQQKEMSGLEFVKGLANGALPMNTIAQTLGYDVVEAESGRVAITLNPSGAHLNPWGTVHGGLTATLLDSCMGLAIQSMLEKGVGSTTRSSSRFRSSEPSRWRRARSGPRAEPSTAAVVSAWQKAG
jgi:acyl-coenzyme A thioesterase PaaI-like protein